MRIFRGYVKRPPRAADFPGIGLPYFAFHPRAAAAPPGADKARAERPRRMGFGGPAAAKPKARGLPGTRLDVPAGPVGAHKACGGVHAGYRGSHAVCVDAHTRRVGSHTVRGGVHTRRMGFHLERVGVREGYAGPA
jgi:hypothetical protein